MKEILVHATQLQGLLEAKVKEYDGLIQVTRAKETDLFKKEAVLAQKEKDLEAREHRVAGLDQTVNYMAKTKQAAEELEKKAVEFAELKNLHAKAISKKETELAAKEKGLNEEAAALKKREVEMQKSYDDKVKKLMENMEKMR